MLEMPVLMELPATFYREIGRITASYAYLEFSLTLTVYDQLPIDPVRGRIAARQPRPKESFEMIQELSALNEIKIGDEFSTLATALGQCQTLRDQVCHGVWVQDPTTKAVHLRVTSGTWQPTKGMRGKEKRKLKPEGQLFDVERLQHIHKLIVSTRDVVLALRKQLQDELAKKAPKR